MSDSFVTQCPHCNTTFRVTPQHLSAAGGSVRCGACLKIFSAKDHLLQRAKPNATTGSPKATDTPATPKPEQTTFIEPEEDEAADASHFSAKSDDDELMFEDDPLFDDFGDLEDLNEEPNAPAAAEAPEYEDDEEYNFGELSDEIETVRPDLRAQQAHSGQAPEEHLVDTQWDALDDSLFKQAERPQLNTENTPEREQFSADRLSVFTNDPDALDFNAQETPARGSSGRKNDMVDHINADPLELHFDNRGGKRWLWGLGVVVLMLVALAQVAWFGIDQFGRSPVFRPWYETLCESAGCTLPNMVDVGQFRTGNLILRKDLRRPGNLIVDAILINQAPFDQQFPHIILEFKNINGVLIADGSFSPEQYLSGEMTGAIDMPSKTPVHISFSVVSPGNDAVNYSLRYQ